MGTPATVPNPRFDLQAHRAHGQHGAELGRGGCAAVAPTWPRRRRGATVAPRRVIHTAVSPPLFVVPVQVQLSFHLHRGRDPG